MKRIDGHWLDYVRDREEIALAQFWEESFNIGAVVSLLRFRRRETGERGVQFRMRAFNLPVHEALGGSVHETCRRVVSDLGLDVKAFEFYVSNDANFNAESVQASAEDEPDCVVINRGLLERVPPSELAFIVGHEVGHLAYDHSRVKEAIQFVYPEYDKAPPLFQKLYAVYSNVCEISADRVGLVACGDVETAVRALFRISSGLDDRFFNPNLSTMMEITDHAFAAMTCSPDYMVTSHPANPIRIKALLEFGRSKLWNSVKETRKQVEDAELGTAMSELLSLIRRAPLNEREKTELVFLASAGVCLMAADKQICDEETNYLHNILSDYIHWPPSFVETEMKGNVMKALRDAAGEIVSKYPQRARDLLARLAPLMVRDRRIGAKEMEMRECPYLS
jgi:hypothetical protein